MDVDQLGQNIKSKYVAINIDATNINAILIFELSHHRKRLQKVTIL